MHRSLISLALAAVMATLPVAATADTSPLRALERALRGLETQVAAAARSVVSDDDDDDDRPSVSRSARADRDDDDRDGGDSDGGDD